MAGIMTVTGEISTEDYDVPTIKNSVCHQLTGAVYHMPKSVFISSMSGEQYFKNHVHP